MTSPFLHQALRISTIITLTAVGKEESAWAQSFSVQGHILGRGGAPPGVMTLKHRGIPVLFAEGTVTDEWFSVGERKLTASRLE